MFLSYRESFLLLGREKVDPIEFEREINEAYNTLSNGEVDLDKLRKLMHRVNAYIHKYPQDNPERIRKFKDYRNSFSRYLHKYSPTKDFANSESLERTKERAKKLYQIKREEKNRQRGEIARENLQNMGKYLDKNHIVDRIFVVYNEILSGDIQTNENLEKLFYEALYFSVDLLHRDNDFYRKFIKELDVIRTYLFKVSEHFKNNYEQNTSLYKRKYSVEFNSSPETKKRRALWFQEKRKREREEEVKELTDKIQSEPNFALKNKYMRKLERVKEQQRLHEENPKNKETQEDNVQKKTMNARIDFRKSIYSRLRK